VPDSEALGHEASTRMSLIAESESVVFQLSFKIATMSDGRKLPGRKFETAVTRNDSLPISVLIHRMMKRRTEDDLDDRVVITMKRQIL